MILTIFLSIVFCAAITIMLIAAEASCHIPGGFRTGGMDLFIVYGMMGKTGLRRSERKCQVFRLR